MSKCEDLLNFGGKTITYVRHAKSAGNAGVAGCLEMKSFLAFRDGQLVEAGEQQVIDRVAQLDDNTIDRIRHAQIILVSPLARAMATAIVLLAEVFGVRSGMEPGDLPQIKVVAELREKVRSQSERPGSGSNPMTYVKDVARRYGLKAFGDVNAMQSIVGNIQESYSSEHSRTKNWQPEPRDTVTFSEMINAFKVRLRSFQEDKIVLVGHSGWAHFAFSSSLPAEDGNCARCAAIHGVRQVRFMDNVGVVFASFRPEDLAFRDVELHNCQESSTQKKAGVGVMSTEDAQTNGHMALDTMFTRFVLEKAGDHTGLFRTRLFTLSSGGGKAHMAWATKWGQPRNSIAIGATTTCTLCGGRNIEIKEAPQGRIIQVRAKTVAEACKFNDLLTELVERSVAVEQQHDPLSKSFEVAVPHCTHTPSCPHRYRARAPGFSFEWLHGVRRRPYPHSFS